MRISKHRWKSLLIVVVLSAAATDVFASDRRDAINLCKHEMVNNHRANGTYDVIADRMDEDRFMVSGIAVRPDYRDEHFDCKVKNGHIKKVKFDGWTRDPHGGKHRDDRPHHDRREAISLCKHEMVNNHHANGTYDVTADRIGEGRFMVSGIAVRPKHRDEHFECKVKEGNVKRVKFDGWGR